MHALQLARCLKEQAEVKEFIADGIIPGRLVLTMKLAACLPYVTGKRCSLDKRTVMDALCFDEGHDFLKTWKELIHPILKDEKNQNWAGPWRGGHITNHIRCLTSQINQRVKLDVLAPLRFVY